jgi:SAM-dependent methyltransferase
MKNKNDFSCYLCCSLSLVLSSSQKMVRYDESIYSFYKCQKCRSFSLFPKLSNDIIAKLYSKEYSNTSLMLHEDENTSYLSKFKELKKFLSSHVKLANQSYLDYGCGFNPVTLRIAEDEGLICKGVEFSDDVVEQANSNIPGKIVSVKNFMKDQTKFDYIFMGDIIEHLTEPVIVLQEINSRLSTEGLLIAQGPLQGAFTLSHTFVRIKAKLFQKTVSDFPPYHVLLATKRGMLEVLELSNFRVMVIKISEPHWPAPSIESIRGKPSIQGILFFLIKLIDKCFSKFIGEYGSHYFLVARKIQI